MSVALTETGVLRRWLYAKLISDATLAGMVGQRIFDVVPPEGTLTPYIRWGPTTAAIPVYPNGPKAAYANAVYSVVVWTRSSDFTVVDPIMARVDALLTAASGSVSGGTVFSCRRIRDIEFIDDSNPNYIYRQFGADYAIQAQRA